MAIALLAGVAPACSSPDAGDNAAIEAAAKAEVTRLQAELDSAAATDAVTLAQVRPVRPVLKCVEKLSTTTYKAHWGYTNSSSASVSIPVGFLNRFFPLPINRGQPTVFAPGLHADVVQVPFSRTSLSVWVLGSGLDLATSASKPCPTGGTGGAGTGGAGTGGAGGTAGGSGSGGVGGNGGTAGGGAGGQGQCPSTCDDHNPCTIDLCSAATGFQCSHTVGTDGASCSDGNACTVNDVCLGGICTPGAARTCTASDQCHAAGTCDPATGACSAPIVANGTSCNDGNLCTTGDVCTNGVCQPGIATVCTAPDRCHSVGACDPGTGICTNPPVANGTSCADTNVCNGAEICQAGICSPGTPLSCASANPCQVGSCDATAGCVLSSLPNGTVCQSPGACGAGICNAGTCVSTAATCDDNNPCTADACGPGGACTHTPVTNGISCGDGNACNGAETCQAGVCAAGTPVTCVASDQCHSAGTCNPATGVCSNPVVANGTACSDGNACTQSDVCTAGVCVAGAAVTCAASDQCHAAGTCNPLTGACSNPPVANGTACSDGNACTQSDVCTAGVCQPGAPVTCAASDQCHAAGTCNPSTGTCSNPAATDGTACSDGNACTQSDVCTAGVCQPGASVTCTASDQCHTAGTCNPSTGACSNPARANGTSCSDGNTCTQNDVCTAGVCVSGAPITCTASDQCHTAGACDPSTGICLNQPAQNGTSCSDGNLCTVADSCQGGICAPGQATTCTASDQCHTAGTCSPSTGLCSNPARPDGASCSDGNACTQADTCASGSCVPGALVSCAAPDQCHSSSCDSVTGACVTVAVANGTPCNDGDACTSSDTCQAGACAAGAPVVCAATPDGCHPGVCDHTTGACSNPLACHLYGVGSIPKTAMDGISVTPTTLEDGTSNNLIGGLGSAIAYTGVGNLYVATPDRGPNNGLDSYKDRYYLIELSLSGGTVTASVRGGATLNQAPGIPFTGLSSAFDPTNSPVGSLRLDPEGVRVTPSGTMFVSDEYGPFIYEFGPDGNRIRSLALPSKFLIDHPSADGTLELPPGNTKGRQSNRGMEGLAISPDGSRLIGIMQSPLIQDGALNGSNSRVGTNNRILEYDLATNVTHEYLYQMDSKSYGVSEIVAVNDHQFLVDERDGNGGTAAAFKRFMLIDITGATDISGVANLPTTGTPAGVIPVSKKPFLNLLDSAYGLAGASFPEKVEGIAFGPDLPTGQHTVVITNDNDFLPNVNDNNFYVFAIDPIALPGFQAQPATFPTACVIPAPVTCPGANECQFDGTCEPDNGACNVRLVAAGSPSATQAAGDCHQNQCDATGHVVSAIDNTDIPIDGNQCTNDVCTGGVPSNPGVAAGTPCNQSGGTLCNGSGACVQCLAASDCPGADTACSFRTCTAGVCGVGNVAAGTPVATQTAGDCHQNQCDGAGAVVSAVDDSDLPVDGNACTSDVCTAGVPSNPPAPVNTTCSAGVCDGAGMCVGCTTAAQCPGTDGFCGIRVCSFGVCGFSSTAAGTLLPTQTAGDCKVQACDGIGGVVANNDNSDLPVDGNVCTSDICTAGVPSNPPVAYGTTCGTDLICNTAGSCVADTFRVVRIGDGSAVLSGTSAPVFVEERRVSDGLGVGVVNLPIAASGSNAAFSDSGTATSDGNLALSVDGRYLTLAGYAAIPGTLAITGTTTAAVNRVVARIDATGVVDTSTRFTTAFNSNNIRMAISIDGSGFWAGGAGGATAGAWFIPFGTVGAGFQLTSVNTRTLGIFGNQLYGGSSSSPNLGVYTIGSPPPPTSGTQTVTNLPGQSSTSSYDFVLFPALNGVDTLYVADDTAVLGNTGGGIQKWTKSGGTWTRTTTFSATTTVGFRGLTGKIVGTNVLLIATGAEASADRIVKFVDNGTTVTTTIYAVTSPTNEIFRGVAFSPHN